MKLLQLYYFQTICESQNLTKAAQILHVSQPTLSNTIKELEEEFGITLFYRLNKGLQLTKEGQIVQTKTEQLLKQVEQFQTEIHALGNNQQVIKMGLPPMSSSLVFPRIMQLLQEQYPQIQIQMVENGSLTNREKILDGRLDAAIITSASILPSSFGKIKLSSPQLRFYISSQHPLANQEQLTCQQIAQTPLVLLTDDSFLTTFVTERFKKLQISPHIALKTNQIRIIQQLVENNIAGTILFDGVIIPNQQFVGIPVTDLDQPNIYLIWNAHHQINNSTKKLIQIAKKAFR